MEGFEPRICLYGDVDLSWRLRAKGGLLLYIARAAVQHSIYDHPDQIKVQQVLHGTFSNLLIRARFGRWPDISRGIVMMLKELVVRQAFPGRRRALIRNLVRFALHLPYFRLTKVRRNASCAPDFHRWDYEVRRDGAFHAFSSKRWKAVNEAPEELPLVSVLIRTRDRPALLRQALPSVIAQTYRPLEVVVIEDGLPSCFKILEEFKRHFDVHYAATGEQVGRAGAGNRT